jgi:hypothetical protein
MSLTPGEGDVVRVVEHALAPARGRGKGDSNYTDCRMINELDSGLRQNDG